MRVEEDGCVGQDEEEMEEDCPIAQEPTAHFILLTRFRIAVLESVEAVRNSTSSELVSISDLDIV